MSTSAHLTSSPTLPPTALNLGLLYLHGRGVATNLTTGLQWVRLASKLGNVRAMTLLGYLLSTKSSFSSDEEDEDDEREEAAAAAARAELLVGETPAAEAAAAAAAADAAAKGRALHIPRSESMEDEGALW